MSRGCSLSRRDKHLLLAVYVAEWGRIGLGLRGKQLLLSVHISRWRGVQLTLLVGKLGVGRCRKLVGGGLLRPCTEKKSRRRG